MHEHPSSLMAACRRGETRRLTGAIAWLMAAVQATVAAPQRVEMPLDNARLVWRMGAGLAIEYQGRPVFAPYSSEFVLHDAGWKRSPWQSRNAKPQVDYRHTDAGHRLELRYSAPGVECTQTITAGAGDVFTVEWRYRQTGWDDIQLQLGFSRPTESFWAGADFEADTEQGPVRGAIPRSFSAQQRNPFVKAHRVTVRSLLGTVELNASKPLTLYDYPERHGAFWLGVSEDLPRDEWQTFRLEGKLLPIDVTRGGVHLTRLRLPERVTDGRLATTLDLSRAADGPGEVVIELVVRQGERLIAEKRAPARLTERPRRVTLAADLLHAGQYAATLTVRPSAGDEESIVLPSASVVVAPLMTVMPNLSVYTSEKQGSLLVTAAESLPGTASFSAAGGGVDVTSAVDPGARVSLPFSVEQLPLGATSLSCRLRLGDHLAAEDEVTIYRSTPAPNEVKIDNDSHGILVDGLPTLPVGFYCIHPPDPMLDVEAPYGFTHVAPYRQTASPLDENARRELLSSLDQCAAVGIRVHFDVRKSAALPDSEEKWTHLRQVIELVRDHPALLCWYLSDEPELQHIPPARLEAVYRFIKELDPRHPCTMVFANIRGALAYRDALDIVMTDPYPIPQRPVTAVADSVDWLRHALGPSAPLWVVPQAFGGGEGWAREPSAAELRVMTYLAVIHGATGIQYFIRRPPAAMPGSPLLWNACRQMAAEFAELSPDILRARRPEVTVSPGAVHAAAWGDGNDATVLLANTSNQPCAVEVSVAGWDSGVAQAPFESRTIAIENGAVRDLIDAFGTRAYRLRPVAETAPPDDNLIVNGGFEQFHNVGAPDGYYLSAGSSTGASVRVDSRLARSGRHSLRLITPADGGGMQLRPFPFPITKGQKYEVQLWARGLDATATLVLQAPQLGIDRREFAITPAWTLCQADGIATVTAGRGQIAYWLHSAGVVWVDDVQVRAVAAAQ